ncbi:MAG: hypothetical protein IJS43_05370 [Bacteroidaceae bacterium]|nr:hypothetical protein [Bacteroidaceae bacterium]
MNDDDWQLTDEYFRLLWHTVNRQPLSHSSVRALQTALLSELRLIYNKENAERKRHPVSRQEDIFHRFTILVNEHAAREHAIAFYADRLCLTPNHLGSVIREVSGQTVMQWIHRHIIQQANMHGFPGFLNWNSYPSISSLCVKSAKRRAEVLQIVTSTR